MRARRGGGCRGESSGGWGIGDGAAHTTNLLIGYFCWILDTEEVNWIGLGWTGTSYIWMFLNLFDLDMDFSPIPGLLVSQMCQKKIIKKYEVVLRYLLKMVLRFLLERSFTAKACHYLASIQKPLYGRCFTDSIFLSMSRLEYIFVKAKDTCTSLVKM